MFSSGGLELDSYNPGTTETLTHLPPVPPPPIRPECYHTVIVTENAHSFLCVAFSAYNTMLSQIGNWEWEENLHICLYAYVYKEMTHKSNKTIKGGGGVVFLAKEAYVCI